MVIKNIIGIMSCKGGVGKTTISVNLSVYLSNFLNKKVGLLDADVYSSNHKRFLGINNFNLEKNPENNFFLPIVRYNIYSMSFGYIPDSPHSVLMRGPMVSNIIKYLYSNTEWGDLDYLFIDFPPGTGDVYLGLLRDINFSGVILVTTPQLISIDDLRKSIYMLNKFNINIYCLVENMKFFLCYNCNHKGYVYGNNNFIDKLMKESLIGKSFEVPSYFYINECCDAGYPAVFCEFLPEFINSIRSISLFLQI